MTPKEKADNLYCKFLLTTSVDSVDNPMSVIKRPREMSLICVEEILSTKPHDFVYNGVYGEWINKQDYWNEVKKEIEKLIKL